jgi:nitroimidazol reductase NimA-like FMN-containing flavoprotein (pyridoxamine 5'-phosphate oxidase superfamily)
MSKSYLYLELEDGGRFEVDIKKSELLRLACCDCGLVHEIAFAIEKNGKLGIAMKRNSRATTARRKRTRAADTDKGEEEK